MIVINNKSRFTNVLTPFILFILAFGVRLPYLWVIPRYIDELREVHLGYLSYAKHIVPLHNMSPDIGALHNYILAGIFWLFGPGIYWPRLYVALTSAATVVLLYWLGKQLYNRWIGLVAAAMLLTNGMHILVTHMAWSNCTTPFFFTLALLATVLAEQRRDGKLLILSGFLWGLALQTHASIIVALLALTVYFSRPRFRKKLGIPSKKYLWMGLAFGAGYANMLLYNLLSWGGSIREIDKEYTIEHNPGLQSFIQNIEQMALELLRAVSSTYAHFKISWHYLLVPAFTISLVLLGIGIYYAIRQRRTLPIWLLVAGFVIIPWINERYSFFIATRYIMPQIICALLLMACGAVNLVKNILPAQRIPRKIIICGAVFLLLLTSLQLIPLYGYCRYRLKSDMSNCLSLDLVRTVPKIAFDASTPVIIDNSVTIENNPLPLLFAIGGQHFEKLNPPIPGKQLSATISPWRQALQKLPQQRAVAILSPETYHQLTPAFAFAKLQRFRQHLVLHPRTIAPHWKTVYVAEIILRKKGLPNTQTTHSEDTRLGLPNSRMTSK